MVWVVWMIRFKAVMQFVLEWNRRLCCVGTTRCFAFTL